MSLMHYTKKSRKAAHKFLCVSFKPILLKTISSFSCTISFWGEDEGDIFPINHEIVPRVLKSSS